ncbi:tetratricopeptide repeat protein [Streptomyces sp. NPDC019443]|uniref:tetratricopeptide repeat protein n=1 Tax=Streptomyces sp. NPDC019443 TaxID=3365061 RepID=UPI0037A99605
MVSFAGSGISVHRLLQAVLRARLPQDPRASPPGRHEAEQTILLALPSDQESVSAPSDQWQQLIPHVIALATSTPPGHSPDDAISSYLATAAYLRRQGQDVRAIPLYEATLAQREQVLGDTHPDTLSSRNNLAYAYQAAGDLQRAIPCPRPPSPSSSRSWATATPAP